MKKEGIIRIGNAGGFWGDDPDVLMRQVQGGALDYVTMDYLAEITMSILQKQRKSTATMGAEGGYVYDFIGHFMEAAPLLKEKGVKVITNAGGINPFACASKLDEELKKAGLDFRIGIIEGDDIYNKVMNRTFEGEKFTNMETGESFEKIKDRLESANVYLGVAPIVDLLQQGADVIIAGRVTDTSLVMAPAIFEHGWALTDWDKIAASLVAGHILECGAQASGGNFTDWRDVKKWENFGYPIAEIHADGSFVVTKHAGTGGLINVNVVKEQLVYEMGDPQNYISPDVVVDFTTIKLSADGKDRVRVEGAKGHPPTPFLKVSMAYRNGFTASGAIIVSDADSREKAEVLDNTFWKRLGISFEKRNTSLIGLNSCHGDLAKRGEANEILLRFAVYDQDKSKIEKFSSKIASLILSGPQGIAVTSGRPRVRSVVSYWPCLIDKKNIAVKTRLLHDGNEKIVHVITGHETESSINAPIAQESGKIPFRSWEFPYGKRVKIEELCLARSGDKGDTANIGLIARNRYIYEFIRTHFTASFIKYVFKSFCKGKVIRYELDNLQALNFLLEESLDGGGTQSLMVDAQGKTFASALLNYKVEIPADLYHHMKTI